MERAGAGHTEGGMGPPDRKDEMANPPSIGPTRRDLLLQGTATALFASLGPSLANTLTSYETPDMKGASEMNFVTTTDGTEIFYQDWGPRDVQPLVFHHGWPLTAEEWDAQMLYFLGKGYRVIAHDRRGHGRSGQTDDGNEMDTYAADVEALVEALDLKGAVHIGHSTGGGEATRYVARAKPDRVAKLVLIAAVPPVMVKKDSNPGGLPIAVFDGLRAALAANRSQFYLDIPAGPFYGFNRDGAKVSQGLIQNWWRQGMTGSAKAHYDCIKAFSETDFTEDLKAIAVPALVMHGTDDQIVPYADSGPLSAKLLRNGTLKSYDGFPHGMATTEAQTINADLLTFLQS
jgi:non-heme chloroperoxidase